MKSEEYERNLGLAESVDGFQVSEKLNFILSEPIWRQVEILVTAWVSESYTIIETDTGKAQGLPDIFAGKESNRIIVEVKSGGVGNSYHQIGTKLKRKRNKFPGTVGYVVVFKDMHEEEQRNQFRDKFDKVQFDNRFHKHKCVSYNFGIFDLQELFNRGVRRKIFSGNDFSLGNSTQTSSANPHL